MVLGKHPVPGRPTVWITVGQGATALAEGAGGGCLDIFTLIYPFSPLSPSLWETARYRLKYCLKGPLKPPQPTNQIDKSCGRFTLTRLSLPSMWGGRVVRWCWVNFQCRGVLLIWIIEGQGPIALAVGAGGGWFGHFFSRLSFLSSFSLSLGDGPI